uniref:Uncharacterized protein n=1 Tax=Panagrellus redivivus TaxID=6233 RepID=A0A7E4VFN4_PANRE
MVLILATNKKTHRQSSTLALVAALRIRRGKQCLKRLKPPQPHALAGATPRGNRPGALDDGAHPPPGRILP